LLPLLLLLFELFDPLEQVAPRPALGRRQRCPPQNEAQEKTADHGGGRQRPVHDRSPE
jgi:hypothetical protein